MSSSKRILIVEDDVHIANLLRMHLRDEGYDVTHAASGDEGVRLLESGQWDALVLDLMLPGVDGLEICRRARAMAYYVPIIITSARSSEVHRILGLELGADDYLAKPFSVMELVARVKAMLRRYLALGTLAGAPARENVVTLGGLSLDLDEKQLTVDGAPVRLTATEYRIVALLMQNPGRVYNAEEIYERVWNEPGFSVENTVMVHIRRIREKIEINPKNPKYLKVVWGLGYKMEKAQ